MLLINQSGSSHMRLMKGEIGGAGGQWGLCCRLFGLLTVYSTYAHAYHQWWSVVVGDSKSFTPFIVLPSLLGRFLIEEVMFY